MSFQSSMPSESGELHTLVHVAESRWELPPLATVTLQRVDAPGTWGAFGCARVERALFTVSVAWLPPQDGDTDDGTSREA